MSRAMRATRALEEVGVGFAVKGYDYDPGRREDSPA
jgi:hypothetical protein